MDDRLRLELGSCRLTVNVRSLSFPREVQPSPQLQDRFSEQCFTLSNAPPSTPGLVAYFELKLHLPETFIKVTSLTSVELGLEKELVRGPAFSSSAHRAVVLAGWQDRSVSQNHLRREHSPWACGALKNTTHARFLFPACPLTSAK